MRKILIVDDDMTLRRIYGAYLKYEGFEVFEADNGEDALLKFSDQKIDVVLLDIRMRGVSGWVVMQAIEQFYPQAKVIISSCYPTESQKEMAPHAADYFDKSTGHEALLSKLKSVLKLQADRV